MNLISHGLVKAIYTTLAHSLWQGLLLALFAVIIIYGSPKHAPAKRYARLLASFILFVLGNVYTFIYQLQHIGQHRVTVRISDGHDFSLSAWAQQVADNIMLWPYIAQLKYWLNVHAGLLILLWFIMIALRMIQLSFGLKGLRMLRSSAVSVVAPEWKQYVQHTALAMGIRQTVHIATSIKATVPMTLGYLKPIILVPAGLWTKVSPEALEAILAHELAHIRRRDYLVNLLQIMAETIYFFHPAVWWVSALLRTEREHCCDDAAIQRTGDPQQYLQALVTCEEFSVQQYTLSFAGNGHHLKERVLRLVSGRYPGGFRSVKVMFGLVSGALLLGIFTLFHYARNTAAEDARIVARLKQASQAAIQNGTTTRTVHQERTVATHTDTDEHTIMSDVAATAEGATPVEALVVELEKDGLVAVNAPNVQVRITNNAVVVNGVTIEADASRRYRDYYATVSGSEGDWQVNYERETTP